MEHQILDVDLVLANQVFGNGQIIVEEGGISFRHIKISKPLFKESVNEWLFAQLQKGVPKEGVFCDSSLVTQMGCADGNRVLHLVFSPEKLIAAFDVSPVLLETSGQIMSRYLQGSSVQSPTMVTDYILNQSLSSGQQHHNLQVGGTLSFGEKHIHTSLRSVLNRNSSYSSEYGELRDLYFRDDKQGRHMTLGLQERGEFYRLLAGGSVFNPREDTIALSWGNSSNTDSSTKGAAVFPVQVFMPESGRAEVFLDGALLATEVVGAGITALKTDYWPQGVYEVEIKTWVSGKLYDIQRQMVFKDGSGFSGKASSFWLGTTAPEQRRVYGDHQGRTQSGYQAIMGGSFSYPVTEGFSVNSTVHLSKISSALEVGFRLFLFGKTPFLANVMMTENYSFGGATRLSGSVGKASLAGSYEYFDAAIKQDKQRFQSNRHRFTGSMFFSPARKQQLMFSVRQDFYLGSFSEAVDYRRRWPLAQHSELESQISIQHGNRLKERYTGDDPLASSGFSINFVLTLFFGSGKSQARNRLAIEYRNAGDSHAVLNGSHSRYFENNLVKDLTINGKLAKDKQELWAVTGFSSTALRGAAGATVHNDQQDNNWGVFSNLSGQIGLTANSLNFGQGQLPSAVLLNVSDSGKGLLQANINGRPYQLEQSQSLISLQPYQSHRVQIISKNEGNSQDILQLDRDSFMGTVYPGNVITFDIDAWYAVDVLGWVVDDFGKPVDRLTLVNSRSQALTNRTGLFSMTFDRTSLIMTGYKEGKSCKIDLSNVIKQQGRQPFYRLENIPCHLH